MRKKGEINPLHRRIKSKHNRCQSPMCQNRTNLTVHHKKPISEGGEDIEENILVLCRDCHDKVHGIFKRKRYPTKTDNGH